MIRVLAPLAAWFGFALLVTVEPEPVRVIQSGPHLWHVVGESRSLIRADDGLFIAWCNDPADGPLPRGDVIVAPSVERLGARFTTRRDDVDFTFATTCPEN